MKRLLFLGMVLLLVFAVLMNGCSSSQPSPTSSSPQSSQPATTSVGSDTVFKLKMAHWGFSETAEAQLLKQWVQRIKEKTNGKVDITIYWAETLLKAPDHFKAVDSGLADIAVYVSGISPGVHTLNLICQLPMMGWPGMKDGTAIFKQLYNKTPELQKEIGNVKMLWGRFMPPEHLHTTNKLVRVPADLKGMKINAGESFVDSFASIGAVAQNVPPMDYYTSLERGMVDGIIQFFPAMDTYGLNPLTKYHTLFLPGGTGMRMYYCLMNLDIWNKLPADLQKIVAEEGEWLDAQGVVMDIGEEERVLNSVKGNSTIVELTPDEMKQWKTLFTPEIEKWIKQCEADGWPTARALYNETMQMIEQYNSSK